VNRRGRRRIRSSSRNIYRNSVRGNRGISCRGRVWQQKRWHISTCSTLVSFHGPPTGPSGPAGAGIFRLVITQPPAPKKSQIRLSVHAGGIFTNLRGLFETM
jgi:hypothetical protein